MSLKGVLPPILGDGISLNMPPILNRWGSECQDPTINAAAPAQWSPLQVTPQDQSQERSCAGEAEGSSALDRQGSQRSNPHRSYTDMLEC